MAEREYLIRHMRYPILVEYPDAYGGIFELRMDLAAIYRLGEAVELVGWSPDVQEVRTLQLGRMRAITDLVTGQVYGRPGRFVRDLDVFDGTGDKDQLRAMIHVLVYLARCDGHYAKREKEVLQRIIARWCEAHGHRPEHVTRYALRTRVDESGFRKELAVLSGLPVEAWETLLAGARELAAASGGVKPEEVAVIERVVEARRGG